MKKISVLIFTLGILSKPALANQACTIFPNPISKTIEAYPDRLVAYGKVVKVEARYTEFEVIEAMYGDAAPDRKVKIWDEMDLECNGKWDMGSENIGIVGDSAIVIVPKIVAIKNSWDVLGDYRMPHFYGYHSIFNLKAGAVWYEDRAAGIELSQYSVPEMREIVASYFTPISIRYSLKGKPSPSAYGFDKRSAFDLNGRYLNQHKLRPDSRTPLSR